MGSSMNISKLLFFVAIAACNTSLTSAQKPESGPTKIIICDESSGCTHEYVDGSKYKILTTDQIVLTVSLAGNAKYARVNVMILNKSNTPVDVLPEQFSIEEITPKEKTLSYVPFGKIVKSDARRAGWANAINAFGAGMARQQATTQTASTGTVNATSSDGTYTNGTYNGTSTSTTSVPDYAAQARAQENIRRRREAIAAESQTLSQTSLKANSVLPNQTVGGFVYFDFNKKVEKVNMLIPINGITYEIPFTMIRH
jgi:hypothetical protein